MLIATNLRQWELYPKQPVTYAELLSGAGDQKATSDAFRTLQDIAGQTIWKRIYGDNTVTDGQLVPFQVRDILMTSLRAAETAMKEFSKLANYEEQAKNRFAKLCEEDTQAKKSRTGPCSPF